MITKIILSFILVFCFTGCANYQADPDQQGIMESSDLYAARMQGKVLAEQRKNMELDRKIKEEQLKQLQLQNSKLETKEQ